MRTIKTYANGRFYDTLGKKYLKEEQLAKLINGKEKIKVIMHKTGDDVTKTVLGKLSPLLNTGKERLPKVDNIRKWVTDQIDQRIKQALSLMNLPSRDQIRRLSDDIEKLAKKVDGLQKQKAKKEAPAKLTKKELARMLQE